MSKPLLKAVAIFGGTFDPVHYGHLRSALELSERLDLKQLRLMPCAVPPHRVSPGCTPGQRAAMVELAVEGEPRLLCDDRELHRSGPSYTIDSLMEVRAELGDDTSLSLVMGCDALLAIDGWHRWEEILNWAHVVVIARPGWQLPETGVVAQWLRDYTVEKAAALYQQTAGYVFIQRLRPLDISSTEIRSLLEAGKSVRYLMPESVLSYIQEQGLYQSQN